MSTLASAHPSHRTPTLSAQPLALHPAPPICIPFFAPSTGQREFWRPVANMASYAISLEFDFGDSWQHDHWD
jgi:hypothetical protein